jgi:hypothetical protein
MVVTVKLIVPAFLLFFCGSQHLSAQSNRDRPAPPKFMGHEITILQPEKEDTSPGEGPAFPKAPATVCIEGQCYTAPYWENFPFGNNPKATVVQLKKDLPAILFSAETGGVSGWEIHLALLQSRRFRFQAKASMHFGALPRSRPRKYS